MNLITARIRLMLALSLCLALALTASVPGARAASNVNCFGPPDSSPLGTAILDPGHGGGDTGAVNGSLAERELNLEIGFKVRDALVGRGMRVCMTRVARDPNWSNTQRAQYANGVAQADGRNVLVLIHLNGATNPATDYTRTYWGKKLKDIDFATTMYNALVANLIAARAAGTCQNVPLATSSVGQFADGALLKSNMPATLTESVFLTNTQEGACFNSAGTLVVSRQQEIANALAAGIGAWFQKH